jgi:integrase/recombinase XerD
VYLQGQDLSKNSINRALTALMSFFDWFRAAYPEQIVHDPTTAVEMERVPLPPARDLSEIEVAALYRTHLGSFIMVNEGTYPP